MIYYIIQESSASYWCCEKKQGLRFLDQTRKSRTSDDNSPTFSAGTEWMFQTALGLIDQSNSNLHCDVMRFANPKVFDNYLIFDFLLLLTGDQ